MAIKVVPSAPDLREVIFAATSSRVEGASPIAPLDRVGEQIAAGMVAFYEAFADDEAAQVMALVLNDLLEATISPLDEAQLLMLLAAHTELQEPR